MNQEEQDQNPMAQNRRNDQDPTDRSEGSEASAPRTPGDAQETGNDADMSVQLERDLEEARSKAQTYLDLAQRTQADFVNYKRRVEQERGEHLRSARGEVLTKILPLLDDLDRAIASMPSNLANLDWVQGIVLIGRKLHNTLDAMGVHRVGEVAKQFDPWQEEAIMYEPSEQYPAGTVTQVIQSGYTLDGKVLRPAQVIVSSGPPAQASQ